MKPQYVRLIAFSVGAIDAVWKAVELALDKGAQVTPSHLLAVGGIALCAFALRWPGDVTETQAKAREAELVKSSRPAGYDPKQENDNGP